MSKPPKAANDNRPKSGFRVGVYNLAHKFVGAVVYSDWEEVSRFTRYAADTGLICVVAHTDFVRVTKP